MCQSLTWNDCEVSRPVVETPPGVGHKANVHSRIGTGNPSEVNKVLEGCQFLYGGMGRKGTLTAADLESPPPR